MPHLSEAPAVRGRMLVLAALACLLGPAILLTVSATRIGGWAAGRSEDFQWSPAYWFARGVDPYQAFLAHDHVFLATQYPNYLHLLYLLLAPVGLLPFAVARVVWVGANAAMVATASFTLGRLGGLGWCGQLVLVTCTLASGPAYFAISKGQLTPLVLVCAVLAVAASGVASGAGLACALTKYSFGPPLVLALLLRRRWREVGVTVLFSTLALLVFSVVTGTNPVRAAVEPFQVSRVGTVEGIGDAMTVVGLLPIGSRSVTAYVVALVLCLTLVWAGRRVLASADALEVLALTFVISLACFMHWSYDYLVLAPVAVVALRRRRWPRLVLFGVVAWFWLGWNVAQFLTHGGATTVLCSVSFVLLLAAFLTLVRMPAADVVADFGGDETRVLPEPAVG